jgi:hypothetical protein
MRRRCREGPGPWTAAAGGIVDRRRDPEEHADAALPSTLLDGGAEGQAELSKEGVRDLDEPAPRPLSGPTVARRR